MSYSDRFFVCVTRDLKKKHLCEHIYQDFSFQFQVDELSRLFLEDLNSSIFTTRYFMHSKEFFYRAAGFVILGLPSFAVLPLLLYLVIAGTITVERLVGVCCTLVGVPVLAVCIACTVVWYRNSKQVWTVHNFYLKCPEMRSTLEFIFCNKRLVGSLYLLWNTTPFYACLIHQDLRH